jgi:hypothetical protein
MKTISAAFAGVLCLSTANAQAPAQPAAAATSCPATAGQPLGFWMGSWDVYAGGKLDGHDLVESTLDGCAVIEHWDDASGFRGMSVFYFEPHGRQWKQVWVTDHALAPGGTKEKTLLHATPDSARFQGSVWVGPDRMVLDRTTLHRLDDGRVAQLIEYSKDGGTTWKTTYDAIYRPAPKRSGEHAGH